MGKGFCGCDSWGGYGWWDEVDMMMGWRWDGWSCEVEVGVSCEFYLLGIILILLSVNV